MWNIEVRTRAQLLELIHTFETTHHECIKYLGVDPYRLPWPQNPTVQRSQRWAEGCRAASYASRLREIMAELDAAISQRDV